MAAFVVETEGTSKGESRIGDKEESGKETHPEGR